MPVLSRTVAVFVVLQLLGTSGSVIAATVKIESIMLTGAVFSLTGLILAILGMAVRCGWSALLGGSAILISVVVFLLIFLLRWSPNDAEYPVPIILGAYELAILPIGLVALWRSLGRQAKLPLQFNLRAMLIATAGVACIAALGRQLSFSVAGMNQTLAIALAAVVAASILGVLAIRLWRPYRGFRCWQDKENSLQCRPTPQKGQRREGNSSHHAPRDEHPCA